MSLNLFTDEEVKDLAGKYHITGPEFEWIKETFKKLLNAAVEEKIGKPVAWIENHKAGMNLEWDPIHHDYAEATPLYAIKSTKE